MEDLSPMSENENKVIDFLKEKSHREFISEVELGKLWGTEEEFLVNNVIPNQTLQSK